MQLFIYPNLLQYIALFFIGVINAFPHSLMGTTLSIWLTQIGFEKSTIGLFSLVHLPFTVRLIWVPLTDSRWRRKSWAMLTLTAMSLSLLGLSYVDVASYPKSFATLLMLLSFFTGGFYVTGIAYELECLDERHYSMGSAFVTTGYRIGLVLTGAGALYLSSFFCWSSLFRYAAAVPLCLGIYLWLIPEPFRSQVVLEEKQRRVSQYSSKIYGLWQETLVKPCKSLFCRAEWQNILYLLLLFKSGNLMLKSMMGPFYLSLGLSVIEIASMIKIWGLTATIVGSLAGGVWFRGKDHFQAVMQLCLLNSVTLGAYFALTLVGKNYPLIYAVVTLEHFIRGLSITTFIFFLWRVCDKQYAAIQYAMLLSIYSIKGDLMACLGGFIAERMCWTNFFAVTLSTEVVMACFAIYILKPQRKQFLINWR